VCGISRRLWIWWCCDVCVLRYGWTMCLCVCVSVWMCFMLLLALFVILGIAHSRHHHEEIYLLIIYSSAQISHQLVWSWTFVPCPFVYRLWKWWLLYLSEVQIRTRWFKTCSCVIYVCNITWGFNLKTIFKQVLVGLDSLMRVYRGLLCDVISCFMVFLRMTTKTSSCRLHHIDLPDYVF